MTRKSTQEERWDRERICIPVEYLRECFECDAQAGVLTWKVRPRSHFSDLRSCNTFNSRFAGKMAGGKSPTGYSDVCVDDEKLRAHRVIWAMHTGAWPIGDLDHRSRDRSENGIENLREATHSQNIANMPVSPRNKVGLKGVCAHNSRYRAQIKSNGKVRYLGMFDTPELAHAAYCEAARHFHGEFAGGLCA